MAAPSGAPPPTLAQRWETHRLALVENYDSHPVALAVRRMETGKMALTIATSSMIAPVISDKFPKTPFHYWLMLLLSFSCFLMWIGEIYRNLFGFCLQTLGVVLSLVWTAGLMGVFLPPALATACLVMGGLCAAPIIDIILRPKAGLPADAVPASDA